MQCALQISKLMGGGTGVQALDLVQQDWWDVIPFPVYPPVALGKCFRMCMAMLTSVEM